MFVASDVNEGLNEIDASPDFPYLGFKLFGTTRQNMHQKLCSFIKFSKSRENQHPHAC